MQMYKKGFYLTMAWFHRVFMRPDEVQAQHSYESSWTVWDILTQTWAACEGKHP